MICNSSFQIEYFLVLFRFIFFQLLGICDNKNHGQWSWLKPKLTSLEKVSTLVWLCVYQNLFVQSVLFRYNKFLKCQMQNFKSLFLCVIKQYKHHWQNENNTNCAEKCYQRKPFQFGLSVINCVSFENVENLLHWVLWRECLIVTINNNSITL